MYCINSVVFVFTVSLGILSFRSYKAVWRTQHLTMSEGYFKSVRTEMNPLIGKLVDFDPAVKTWEQYAERVQHFFDTNEIQDDSRKRSILLSVLTPKNYKLLCSLLSLEQLKDKSFAQIVEVSHSLRSWLYPF